MIFRELESFFVHELSANYPERESLNLCRMVLEEYTGWSYPVLIMKQEEEVQKELFEKCIHILHELKSGRPIQYIIGKCWFYGFEFMVNESVLIPRPETEELVGWVLETFAAQSNPVTLLDIGTGSGCIALSVNKSRSDFYTTWAIDISPAALRVASRNAIHISATCQFMLFDILNPGGDLMPNFNVVVSNPPYVLNSEKEEMEKHVLDHEPSSALFVDDREPLLFYKAIADFSRNKLLSGGFLFFEINSAFGKEVTEMLEQKGFQDVILKKDLSGRDRMVRARKD